MPIGLGRGDAEGWLEQKDRQGEWRLDRLEAFAAATDAHGRIAEKKWHIRADAGGECDEATDAELAIVQLIERKQGRRRIAAATTEAGTVRDGFFQMNRDAAFGLCCGFVSAQCFDHQIALVAGHGRVVAGK